MSNAGKILTALGGTDNVSSVAACITRLRVGVEDAAAVSEEGLKEAGAYGVVVHGHTVQVVVGPDAERVAEELSALR